MLHYLFFFVYYILVILFSCREKSLVLRKIAYASASSIIGKPTIYLGANHKRHMLRLLPT